jgi:hypothetical protein
MKEPEVKYLVVVGRGNATFTTLLDLDVVLALLHSYEHHRQESNSGCPTWLWEDGPEARTATVVKLVGGAPSIAWQHRPNAS